MKLNLVNSNNQLCGTYNSVAKYQMHLGNVLVVWYKDKTVSSVVLPDEVRIEER